MIVYILVQFYEKLETPLDVYYKFFEVYGNINWVQEAVTMFGIFKISSISNYQVSIQDIIYRLTHDEAGEFRNEIIK